MAVEFSAKTDYRIAMAVYAVDVLYNLASEGKIPGIRKSEALELLEKMSSCINKMRETKMSKKQLLTSNLFRTFNNLLSTFISRLGVNWYRIAKRRDDYTAKLLRFAIFNLRSLGNRLKRFADDDPAGAVKVVYARVLTKKNHPKNSKYKILNVTDMEMIYEVATDADVEEKSVVVFAHTPPVKIDGFVSEGIILKDENGNPLLGDEESVGQMPSEIPDAAKKQIADIVLKILEEEFLI